MLSLLIDISATAPGNRERPPPVPEARTVPVADLLALPLGPSTVMASVRSRFSVEVVLVSCTVQLKYVLFVSRVSDIAVFTSPVRKMVDAPGPLAVTWIPAPAESGLRLAS